MKKSFAKATSPTSRSWGYRQSVVSRCGKEACRWGTGEIVAKVAMDMAKSPRYGIQAPREDHDEGGITDSVPM